MKPERETIPLLRGGQMWWMPSQMEEIVTPSAVCRHTGLYKSTGRSRCGRCGGQHYLTLNSGKKQHTHNCPNSTRSF